MSAVISVDDVYLFQEEQCKCQKGKCLKRRCSCRKNGRHCSWSKCKCNEECQNREDELTDDEDSGEAGEGSSMSASASTASVSCEVPMQCAQETYDRDVHNAPWHNDNPFVLELCTAKLSKCRGCGSKFNDPKEPNRKFVISHEEQREFWTAHGRRTALQKAFYHCSASCISPRHPYFKPREVTSKQPVARSLTVENIQLIKHHGIDLAFMRTLKQHNA